MKKLLILLVLSAIIGGGVYYYRQQSAGPQVVYRTAPVVRGDLLSTIGATGTVEPIEVIDVGAQVAGRILTLGDDPFKPGTAVDYGSAVEEGTVLARIDDSLYVADVQRGEAEVAQAKANVMRAKADLGQMKAKLLQAEQNWKRAKDLGPSRALAATDYESYVAAYETAKAEVAVGEATIAQTEKAVLQSEAALKRASTNLGYCTIKSPVKGVIIDRRVNVGQTVVSSLNAPSLFLIAKDLTRMQVWAAVNEADIGHIRPGQAVTFTVDAFSGRNFQGQVNKIRLNASMTQNVVTYTVEINTDNSDGILLPYLTANLRFEVERREAVLMLPNAALRWTPSPEQIAPDAQPQGERQGGREDRGPRHGAGSGRPPSTSASRPADAGKTVWVRDGRFVRAVDVTAGLSDGTFTEILNGDLKEGTEVVVGEIEQGGGDETTTNPFAPRFFRGSGRTRSGP